MRIFIVALEAEIFHRVGGMDAVLAAMRQRSGKLYDPHLADRCHALARSLLC